MSHALAQHQQLRRICFSVPGALPPPTHGACIAPVLCEQERRLGRMAVGGDEQERMPHLGAIGAAPASTLRVKTPARLPGRVLMQQHDGYCRQRNATDCIAGESASNEAVEMVLLCSM